MVIDRALAERLERKFVGMPATIGEWLARHPDEPVRASPLAGGWVTEPLAGAKWGGGAFGLGLQGPLTEEDFRVLLDAAARVGPRFRVVVCPYCDVGLPQRLVSEGFAVEGFRTVLIRKTPTSAEFAQWEPSIAGVDVRRIDVSTELERYIDVVLRGFNSGAAQPEVDQRMSRITGSYSGARLFLATVDGKPAGGGRLDLAGGVGFFFGASVLPEFRNQGVHRALLVARMRAAALEGCDLLTIGSLAGAPTERNTQRLGFEVAYTSLELMRGPV